MRFVKLHKKDGGEFVISEQLLETCLIVQSDGYTEVSAPHLVYRKGCVPVRETPEEILAMIGGERSDKADMFKACLSELILAAKDKHPQIGHLDDMQFREYVIDLIEQLEQSHA